MDSEVTGRMSGGQQQLLPLLARATIVALACLLPWAFGGVHAASLWWAIATVTTVLGIGLLFNKPSHLYMPWISIPLGATILLALVQLVPLPRSLLQFASPGAVRLRDSLATPINKTLVNKTAQISQKPESAPPASWLGTKSDWGTISMFPAATRRQVALLAYGASILLLGAWLFHEEKSHRLMFIFLSINGALLAGFALVQQLTSNGMIYWVIPLSESGEPFGPYVNRNNAAGYLTLCLAANLGWLLSSFDPSRIGSGREDSRHDVYRLSWWESTINRVASMTPEQTFAVGTAVLTFTGILLSGFRGGILSAMVAILVVMALAFKLTGKLTHIFFAASVLVLGFGLVWWVNRTDPLTNRLKTLLEVETLAAGQRQDIVASMSDASHDFWPLGSGLGTFGEVYSIFQKNIDILLAQHADNQYTEMFLEMGLSGILLLAVGIACAVCALVSLGRQRKGDSFTAILIAVSFALVAQIVHAATDFGVIIPANLTTFALLLGAASGTAVRMRATTNRPNLVGISASSPSAGLAVVFSLLMLLIFGLIETSRATDVHQAIRESEKLEVDPSTPPTVLDRNIAALNNAARYCWDDAKVHRRLAELHVERYRLRALQTLKTSAGPAPDIESLWEATKLSRLYAKVHLWSRSGEDFNIDELRASSMVRTHLDAAYHELQVSRQFCPLLPKVHFLIGELTWLHAAPELDERHFERAIICAPANSTLRFACGMAFYQAGHRDKALESWKACLALSTRNAQSIFDVVAKELSGQEMVSMLLPDSPELIIKVAQGRFSAPEQIADREALLLRAEALLASDTESPFSRYYWKAKIALQRNKPEEAKHDFEVALQLRPTNVAWRYELAMLLERLGQYDASLRELQRCSGEEPTNRTYLQAVKRVTKKRDKRL